MNDQGLNIGGYMWFKVVTTMCGKVLDVTSRKYPYSLRQFETMLSEAIEDERYEDAAWIRDAINDIKNDTDSGTL
jgi:protein-arginine kinase activator protein McsA